MVSLWKKTTQEKILRVPVAVFGGTSERERERASEREREEGEGEKQKEGEKQE